MIDENEVRSIVTAVLDSISSESDDMSRSPESSDRSNRGVFLTMDQAIEASRAAFQTLDRTPLEVRKRMIAEMRRLTDSHVEALSSLAASETGLGKSADKIIKNRLVIWKTPGVEDLEPASWTDDHGLTLTERAPYGVIGAITPSTNPTETIICNAIGMVAAGNAVVFNPHPSAAGCSRLAVSLLNEAAVAAGGPENIVATVMEPTIESATYMMWHEQIAMLCVTGGPGVVRAAMQTNKKVIAAGPGNPPAVVDSTADIPKAARDLVHGASLDNNIICTDEKEVLAVASITDELKAEMRKHSAIELDAAKTKAATELFIASPGSEGEEGSPNKRFVGQDAAILAEAIGVSAPSDTRLLFCEVPPEHPLVWTEQLMPILPIVRFQTVDETIDFAVRCERGFRHTASMHSRNIDKLSRMARLMNCSLFVKNGANYMGLGEGGAGFTSFTIASPTGEGMTRARTFSRERRCALIGSFRIV